MDYPAKKLGKKHRSRRHGILTPFIASIKFKDPKVIIIVIVHIIQDHISTFFKRSISHQILWVLIFLLIITLLICI